MEGENKNYDNYTNDAGDAIDIDFKLINKYFKQCKFSDLADLIKNDYLEITQHTYLYQAILSIYVFCLLKLNKYDQVYEIYIQIDSTGCKKDEIIFALKFLEGKYYYLIVSIYIYNIYLE
jgi:hypothetical protein